MSTVRFYRTFSALGWLALLSILSGPLLAAPETAAVAGEERISLDGTWQFSINPDAGQWVSMQVPGNWDTHPAFATYKGKGWYRRDFDAPAEWRGRPVRLRFEAVNHDATVWLNGVELGTHSGGYTPFEFDVRGALKPGSRNTVLVCADNTYRRGAWWHWGGISRSVAITAYHPLRLVWQHVRAEPNLTTGEATVQVTYKVMNLGDRPLPATLTSMIDHRLISGLSGHAEVPAGADVIITAETVLPRVQVRLWDFDHPNLYVLRTELSSAGQVMHARTDRFGIRKVELTSSGLILNGERVRLDGYNRVADSLEYGNTEPDVLVHRDVDLMKRANGNLCRLIHYPQAPNLLDYLDEKGMLIWCEIPVWGRDDPHINPDDPMPRQWMAEMIERDYNHPCIIGWSVGNEMRNHYAYTAAMLAYTRTLDPSRMATHVSNSGALPESTPANDPITCGPIILHNTYARHRDTSAILHAKWPDKPIFYSEFGLGQFGAKPDSRIDGIEDLYRLVTVNHPYVIGVSLWTFNDYRSDYRGTPASGNREWGIVDVERRPKAAYEQIRRLFSPVHALTYAHGVVRIEPRSPDEVPSFTLRGYRLRWDGGEVAVADLKPGDPAWSAAISAPAGATIQLVAPTGYDVADTRQSGG